MRAITGHRGYTEEKSRALGRERIWSVVSAWSDPHPPTKPDGYNEYMNREMGVGETASI